MNFLVPVIAAILMMLGLHGDQPGGRGAEEHTTVGAGPLHPKIDERGNGVRAGESDGNVRKRPCWYEPGLDASEMLEMQQGLRDYWFKYTKNATEAKFEKFLKQFKDKVGEKGRWWGPAYDAADPMGEACFSSLDPFVFVPSGTRPPHTLRCWAGCSGRET
ncbi:hypothetical protein GBF35_06235 [Nonomuraea phyllanthi]|uniref:hypothetical protein n=1 Tax=Nonomuraea phyllanthi TaxID=2219224 RepID=UPI00129407CB|nr:hypothetical protein [Nonomuraea phyllanthi]QFY06328.1 hypothetical protein GBF35_06235 [Nonomuraea phyllanthi]